MQRIIGITGMNGAGKGTVVEYLKQKGFAHYSSSGFITEEILRRGLIVDRPAMIAVGNDLREHFGSAYVTESLYARAQASGGDAIIESLRALGEVAKVRELGGYILGVDADPRIRYQRALARGGVKDGVTFDQFFAQERSEMNAGDPFKQDLRGALAAADVVIQNNGTLEELQAQVDGALAALA